METPNNGTCNTNSSNNTKLFSKHIKHNDLVLIHRGIKTRTRNKKLYFRNIFIHNIPINTRTRRIFRDEVTKLMND